MTAPHEPRTDPAARAAAPRPAAPPGDVTADIAAIARIGAVPTILQVVSEATGLRLALIARVTRDSWTCCAVLDRMNFGLHVGDRLEVATTLCSEVRDTREPVIIEHASQDPAFCAHPTPRLYGFESYIAVPIFRPDGEYFGNVCALDSEPARLRDGKTRAMLELFAQLISQQLAAEEAAAEDRAALSDAQRTAELREQFIAVLGHDLRNSLFAVLSGAGFLLTQEQETRQRTVLERIHASGERMARLVDDIMDFARGRLGGGMSIKREEVRVDDLVHDVADEIASAHPDRAVQVSSSDECLALLDRSRVAQMLSNLIANAAQHGAPDQPIAVRLSCDGDEVELAVTNRGAPIPAAVMPRLFQPFFRGVGARRGAGLGLGLYIAAEIARAHGGMIDARSSADGETTFTVTLPRKIVRPEPSARS